MIYSNQISSSAQILLVNDDDIEIEITKIALQRIRCNINLSTVSNGKQCMDFLLKYPPYITAPTPDLVLLDLNMPRMSGLEVLKLRGAEAALRHIPFVMLTTSSDKEDIRNAYELGCNTYVTKPLEFHHYARVLRSLFKYWFFAATLPAQRSTLHATKQRNETYKVNSAN